MQTPPSTRRTKPPTLRYVCLTPFFVAVLAYQTRSAWDVSQSGKVDIPFVAPAIASASLETVSPGGQKVRDCKRRRTALNQRQLSRLETGGTVIGLLESFPDEQGVVTISPDDAFVAYTDGISEAMNNGDEEWASSA